MIFRQDFGVVGVPPFNLTFAMGPDDTPVVVSLEASDEGHARKVASIAIAEALGRPDVLVLLEPSGWFTAGVGFWSRRGHYVLSAQPAPTQAGAGK